MTVENSDSFYDRVPVFSGFANLMDPALYGSVPDDWVVGTADIVNSTGAIAAQRYKAVNMAGASVIAAIANALQGRDFPYVFGGDGASFAVAPRDLAAAREAMAAAAAWVRDELELTLRIALVPVATIRDRGLDVRIARFAPSPHVRYAMFAGGGLGWAEAAMKRGEFLIDPAPPGTMPDLSGLSCRFETIPAAHGVILTLLLVPTVSADNAAFRALVEQVVALTERSPDAGRPVPSQGPTMRWPPAGFELEARAAGRGPLLVRRIGVLLWTLFVYVIMRFGISFRGFVPQTYMAQVPENSDFRKYDDGLRMILDCPPDVADALEQRLADAAAAGIARYGVFRQDAAMMTCFTPSAARSDHVHFVDGAGGGYAAAAVALKAMRA